MDLLSSFMKTFGRQKRLDFKPFTSLLSTGSKQLWYWKICIVRNDYLCGFYRLLRAFTAL